MLDQETELKALEAMLAAIEPTFIDVGAERGDFSGWLAARGLKGCALEPLPQHAATLQALAANGAVRFLPYAADAEDGERDLHIATDSEGRPMDHFHSLQPLANDARVRHTRTVRVVCRSLGSLVREGALPPRVGLLKIDTEGNDLRVMQGVRPLQAQVLIAEYFTEGIYAGWRDAAPAGLRAAARELGYTHCLAVRRRREGLEWVTYQPLAFQPGEWGNLLFTGDAVFDRSAGALAAMVSAAEQNLLRQFAELQLACNERLELIDSLHGEAKKRLQIIQQLTRDAHKGGS